MSFMIIRTLCAILATIAAAVIFLGECLIYFAACATTDVGRWLVARKRTPGPKALAAFRSLRDAQPQHRPPGPETASAKADRLREELVRLESLHAEKLVELETLENDPEARKEIFAAAGRPFA